jgi:hypothetical protein
MTVNFIKALMNTLLSHFTSHYSRFALLWCVLAACGRPVHKPASEATDLRAFPAYLAPTRSATPLPLFWVDARQDEVYPDLNTTWNNPAYYPDESPETRRLQYWLDELSEELMRLEPERFVRDDWSIPRPRVRIMRHSSINAFVSTRSVCYRSRLRLAQGASEPSSGPELTMMINKKGRIGLYESAQMGCLDRSDEPVPASWVARYLEENVKVQNCSFRLVEDILEFGTDCHIGSKSGQAWVGKIALDAVTPWITITEGALLHVANEDEAVMALAHELVHYYQAHGALVKANYNYFYRQTDDNLRLPRPVPDPELRLLGEALLKLPAYRTQAIDGQSYHSDMFSYFRTAAKHLVQPSCGDPTSPCYDACAPLLALAESPEFQAQTALFPQSQLKGQARAQYFLYEQEYKRCSAVIPLRDGENFTLGSLPRDRVKLVYWKVDLADQAQTPTLGTVVEQMNQLLQREESERSEIYQSALDKRLGYYTTEQEADLLALQWTAFLGLKAEVGRNFWLQFMRVSEEQDSAFNFAYERCLEVYQSTPRWTRAGVPVLVPVGSFADPHHSKCHRLYQVDRRLQAVSFPQGQDRRSEAEIIGGRWDELFRKPKASADQIAERPPAQSSNERALHGPQSWARDGLEWFSTQAKESYSRPRQGCLGNLPNSRNDPDEP